MIAIRRRRYLSAVLAIILRDEVPNIISVTGYVCYILYTNSEYISVGMLLTSLFDAGNTNMGCHVIAARVVSFVKLLLLFFSFPPLVFYIYILFLYRVSQLQYVTMFVCAVASSLPHGTVIWRIKYRAVGAFEQPGSSLRTDDAAYPFATAQPKYM